jgi:hypothetical protein
VKLALLALVALVAAVAASAAPAMTAAPACTGTQLRGTFAVVRGSAGAGNIVYRLTVTNVSSATCTLTGLPVGTLLGRKHNPLATHIRAAHPQQLLAVLVTLDPGNAAVANARFSPDVPGPGEPVAGMRCEPVAYWLRVRAPGGRAALAPIKPPTSVCEHGALSFDAYSAR